jgi:SPP1 gp7 family putative phage head morphogenesis protein
MINKALITKAGEDDFNIQTDWKFNRKQWDKRLQKYGAVGLKKIVEQEGYAVMKDLRSRADLPAEVGFDVENPNVDDFLDEYSFKFAQSVNDTTEAAVRMAIGQGMEEGMSMDEIAGMLDTIFDDPDRAMMIARTETIRASNYAAAETYRQSGVVQEKEWLVTDDSRTCPICLEMNGQRVGLDENFNDVAEAAGADLSYGDIEAPPAHIFCRCCLVPVVAEFDGEGLAAAPPEILEE